MAVAFSREKCDGWHNFLRHLDDFQNSLILNLRLDMIAIFLTDSYHETSPHEDLINRFSFGELFHEMPEHDVVESILMQSLQYVLRGVKDVDEIGDLANLSTDRRQVLGCAAVDFGE